MTDIGPARSSLPGPRETGVTGWDDPRRPVIVVDGARRRDPLDTVLRLLTGLALLLVVLLLGAMLLLVLNLAGTLSSAGSGLGQTGAQLVAEAQRLAERAVDLTDPAHPPRGDIQQDTEFDDLRIVPVGQSVVPLDEYTLTLMEIRKRDGAAGRDDAQYAVLRKRLKEPRLTSLGPLTVREDWDESDLFLYKGETVQLDQEYYRVNWVSVDEGSMAVGRYRSADDLTVAPKYEIN